MPHSTTIVAAMLGAFVLYLAAKNRLASYAAVLWGSTAQPVPIPADESPTSGTPNPAAYIPGGDETDNAAGDAATIAAAAVGG